MIFPATTAFYAGLLALVYLGLSGWVIGARVSGNVLLGDGGDDTVLRRVRSHANFAEYVPLALIVIGLLEASGGSHGLVRALLVALLVAGSCTRSGCSRPRTRRASSPAGAAASC